MAKATGGTITTSGDYTIHTFTSSGTFSPSETISNVEVLIVAAGGGASIAGGGAGDMIEKSGVTLTATDYAVVVGVKGTGTHYTVTGNDGGNSSFNGDTAKGGGGGGKVGTPPDGKGRDGGSSGGGGSSSSGNNDPGSVTGIGHIGGKSYPSAPTYPSGAGGGINGVGTDASSGTPGTGGPGKAASISGTSVTYSKGGNGCLYNNSTVGVDGTNPGDGGNGASDENGGGDGHDGIVIIRYLTGTTASSVNPSPICIW